MSFLPLVRIWIWVSVLASVAGWLLSALGELNRLGYLLFCGAVAVCFWLIRRGPGQGRPRTTFNWKKFGARFRRWLPGSVAVLALLVLLGGGLYPPSNHDGLAYRTPRVLHWLAAGQWHWIHTPNYRMNDRACGFEWITAPLLLFTGSDRGLFLINYVSFLLLPGLVFSVFTRLGVRPRVAWYWMWLLPTGYIFLTQAGSIANDAFAAVYALAALDFGLRARCTRDPSDLWVSVLSAALLTGSKGSNLPLLLPWAIAVCGLLPLVARRPLATLCVGLLAGLASFLPTAALNVFYCKDWSGAVLEPAGLDLKNPIVGIWGNSVLLLLKNLVPPFFPIARWWNHEALLVLPHSLVAPLVASFEPGFHGLGELPTEEWAGIGLGLSFLIVVTVLGSLRHWVGARPADGAASGSPRDGIVSIPPGIDPLTAAEGKVMRGTGRAERGLAPTRLRRWLVLAPWIALLVYCAKSGLASGARLITPYYPLLLPLVLGGAGPALLVRRRWWRVMVGCVVGSAFALVAVLPGRPLWPARTVLPKMLSWKPGHAWVVRALNVYTVYADRSDPLAAARALLPKEARVVGFLANGTDLDISLWRPFGHRRVEHLLVGDSPAYFRQRHIEYAVVAQAYLTGCGVSLADWLNRSQAELVATTSATMTITEGPLPWYIVRFKQ